MLGGKDTPIMLEKDDRASHVVMTKLAEILLGEYMGYDVSVSEEEGGAAGMDRLAKGTVHANAEVWPYEYKNKSGVDSLGGNGLNGQKGWFIPENIVKQQYDDHGRMIDHWQSLKKQEVRKLFQPPTGAVETKGETHCKINPELAAGNCVAHAGWYRPKSGVCDATVNNCITDKGFSPVIFTALSQI